MEVIGVAITVVVGVPALVLGWLTYRDRQPKVRLEYIVTTASALLPEEVDGDVEVIHGGEPLSDPALVIVRIVNTGETALAAADYETPLKIHLEGVAEVATASRTAQRPDDLEPEVSITGNTVVLEPVLINPEDMLQIQIITAGVPTAVELAGRVSKLSIVRLPRLPYPPGGGPEGELEYGFEKFMWYLALPLIGIAVAAMIAQEAKYPTVTRIALPATILFSAVVLYPLRAKQLTKRRAMWRP